MPQKKLGNLSYALITLMALVIVLVVLPCAIHLGAGLYTLMKPFRGQLP